MCDKDRRPLLLRWDAEDGLVVIAMLAIISLLLGLGVAVHVTSLQDTRLRGALQRTTQGFYAAEAGAEVGMAFFRNKFLNWGVPQGSDFGIRSVMIGEREVRYSMTKVDGYPQSGTIPAGQAFGGASAHEFRYVATSTSHGPEGDTEASIGIEFRVHYIPLFQFLAFYEYDLEILPGPDMNLHGPIHTNGDLYLGAGNTLTIEDLPPVQPTVRVTAGGMIFRGRKDKSQCSGDVVIDMLLDSDADGDLDPRGMPCAGEQTAAMLTPWLGSVLRDIDNISLPGPDNLVRGTGQYWQQADLRIALDLTTPDAAGRFPIVVLRSDETIDVARTAQLDDFIQGNPGRIFYTDVPTQQIRNVNCGVPPAVSYCHQDSYTPAFSSNGLGIYPCTPDEPGCMTAAGACLAGPCFNAAYVAVNGNRRGGFYDNRELQWVYLLNVNVGALLQWNLAQAAGDQLFNPADTTQAGLVFFLTVIGPDAAGIPSPRYGARVFGSPTLAFPPGFTDPTGLTVVSDQSLYVEGHYNAGDATNPKQPAAIMADTVNVLSSDWTEINGCHNDCKSGQPRNDRQGADTTINSAFLAGVDITTPGNYNGGLENYPRFHENWGGGPTLTYRGSFVSLGTPRHANGPWGRSNVYKPPKRNWDFDTDFVLVQNLPPLTPRFVHVRDTLFAEAFK